MALALPEPVKDSAQERNNFQFWAELERLRRLFLVAKTAAPAAGDDKNDGIEIGTLWVDETNNNSYQCQDNAVGAAVWAQID